VGGVRLSGVIRIDLVSQSIDFDVDVSDIDRSEVDWLRQ